MERFLDKIIVLTSCLLTAACFLAEAHVGSDPIDPDARLLALAIAMLVTLTCSALTEAASLRSGTLAFSAYCLAACFIPAALVFVPLAFYDCMRCIHRGDVLRFSGALALAAIVACLANTTLPPLSTASLLCATIAACALSARTSTALARQRIARSTRDALASQALSLRKKNRSLRDSLDKMPTMSAQNDKEAAAGGAAAEQKPVLETAAQALDGSVPTSEPSSKGGASCDASGSDATGNASGEMGGTLDGSGATGRLRGGATGDADGNNASDSRGDSGTSDGNAVTHGLSGGIRHELGGSARRALVDSDSGEFASNAALREQLRPTPFACLTEREYEVARLVAEGLDNREIAATAYLSEGTVRNNISSILSKMNLKNRTQIAVAYYKSKGSTR